MNGDGVSLKKLITVPALVSLGVTLVRLVGELSASSTTLFSREAGGGGAVVGSVWLVPVFGLYFAWKLAGAGHGPVRSGPAIGPRLSPWGRADRARAARPAPACPR